MAWSRCRSEETIDTRRSHLFKSVTLEVTGFTHMKLKTEGLELTGSSEVSFHTEVALATVSSFKYFVQASEPSIVKCRRH